MGHERSRSTGSTRPTLPHRYSAPHPNSSAFSASAHANEDWTKISDLAERRRIQNRIAQRNYRKKLKKRLEDLERRASASPEPSPELDQPTSSYGSRSQEPRIDFSPAPASTARYSPERDSMSPDPTYVPRISDRNTHLSPPDDRHLSQSSFSYGSYDDSDDGLSQYEQSPSFSAYSMPSPALSAVSYENRTFAQPGFRNDSAVSSPMDPMMDSRGGYFDQQYPSYTSYGFAADMNPNNKVSRQHFNTPQYRSHPEGEGYSYTHEILESFGTFEVPFNNGSPFDDLWSLYPDATLESPPLLQL